MKKYFNVAYIAGMNCEQEVGVKLINCLHKISLFAHWSLLPCSSVQRQCQFMNVCVRLCVCVNFLWLCSCCVCVWGGGGGVSPPHTHIVFSLHSWLLSWLFKEYCHRQGSMKENSHGQGSLQGLKLISLELWGCKQNWCLMHIVD